VPASVCGAVGVKPTLGRVPHAWNEDADTTEGPLTRTVVDAAMLLDATVGPHPADRFALPATGERYAEIAREDGDLAGLRIAASIDLGGGPVALETREAFAEALELLRSMGATVDDVDINLPDTREFFIAYWGPEYIGIYEEMETLGLDIWPLIAEIAEAAKALTPVQVSNAIRSSKTQIFKAYADIFADHDMFVCPTTPFPAFPHAGDVGGLEVVDGQPVSDPGLAFHRMTESPSHAGVPALSLPCGFSADGLPIGLQIMAPLHADAAVVSAAARYERAAGWWTRHPTL
jgi:Asp-tRNA(Asn)/Glu-tRNA(Gln) amidotransferase A subunit family amidase